MRALSRANPEGCSELYIFETAFLIQDETALRFTHLLPIDFMYFVFFALSLWSRVAEVPVAYTPPD